MIPLLVVAELANGYSAADPWSPSLDGILAYWALRETLGEEAFALGMTGHRPLVEAELPLAREQYGGDWWWVCSSPIVDARGRFDRHFHRRFDLGAAVERVPERTRTVLTAGGPYKAYRNRRTLTVAREIVWHCVGDRDEIARLLARCGQIGFGHTKGWGAVRAWRVKAGGDEDLARFHRPLPEAFAAAHGIAGPVLDWGVRPPGRTPEHRRRCVMSGTLDGG